MQLSILVVDETNNYPLWERIQKITLFHLYLARNTVFPSYTDTSYQSLKTSKQWSSLELAIQASGNSRLHMADNVLENHYIMHGLV